MKRLTKKELNRLDPRYQYSSGGSTLLGPYLQVTVQSNYGHWGSGCGCVDTGSSVARGQTLFQRASRKRVWPRKTTAAVVLLVHYHCCNNNSLYCGIVLYCIAAATHGCWSPRDYSTYTCYPRRYPASGCVLICSLAVTIDTSMLLHTVYGSV